jgi:hypothetical protein
LIFVDPKTAPPFVSRVPVGLFGTFASQLRILARIFFQDEENPIGARYAGKNLLIVPFSLNSMDFRCTEIFQSDEIVQNEIRLAKRARFAMSRMFSRVVLSMVISSDVRCCQGRLWVIRGPAQTHDQGIRPKKFSGKNFRPGNNFLKIFAL